MKPGSMRDRYQEMSKEQLIALLRRQARGPADDERDRLIHELEVHQAELESQNEQLRDTQSLLEESRAAYADLYDFAPMGYCSINDRGAIVQINLAGADLLGTERARLIGAQFARLVDVTERRAVRAHLAAVIAGGQGEPRLHETRMGERVLRLMSAAAKDARGQRICRTALLDITAQTRAEETLRRSLRMREDFLAVISHDLRNPLNAIQIGAEVFLRGSPQESDRRQVEVIRLAAGRMNRLLSDLLDLSSMDAGRLSIALAAQDPDALTAAAVEMLRPQAAEKHVELRSELRAEGVPVSCDRDRTVQVLLNLIGNALKFTPRDGQIVVGVERRGREVIWSVRDSGIGMSSEQRAHIFEPYWKADGASKEGTGLGLAISRGIVERHGGRFWVDSAPGRGSTFSFGLPIDESPGSAVAAPAPALPIGGARGGTMLLVDDEEEAREALAALLRLDGYPVITARDGAHALARLAEQPVSLILLDLAMPGMDGWELLREVRRGPAAEIPIVLISGEVGGRMAAQSLGLAGTVEKPIELAALREAIERATRR